MRTVRGAVTCTVVVAAVGGLAGCGSDAVQVVPGDSPPASASGPASPTGLPPMADGENLDACKDGTCQVVVTAPAEFDVRGVRTSVDVDGRGVTVKQRSGGSTSSITVSGTNGRSSIGTGDGSVTLRLRGVSGDRVALDITYSS